MERGSYPHIEQLFSPDDPSVTAATGLLTAGKSTPSPFLGVAAWQTFEKDIPGATAAGIFVEAYKVGKNARAGVEPFSLAQAVYYDLTNPKTGPVRHFAREYTGEARGFLIALLGGQVMQEALAQGVPLLFDMSAREQLRPPRTLTDLFDYTPDIAIPPYGGGPDSYQAVSQQFHAKQEQIISRAEQMKIAEYVAQQKGLTRITEHSLSAELLLTLIIKKLQTHHEQQTVPALPARRMVVDAC